MLRYFVIATVVVVAIFAGVAAVRQYEHYRHERAGNAHRVKSWILASSHHNGNAPVRGDAPWALSALPECMIQTTEGKGREAMLLAHLPRGARRIVPPVSLKYGDCTLSIVDDEAFVRRGSDRLRIPPVARFYRVGDGIALVRAAPCLRGRCLATLRIYRTAKP